MLPHGVLAGRLQSCQGQLPFVHAPACRATRLQSSRPTNSTAAAPQAAAVRPTEQARLTKAHLIQHIASGSKARDQWRLGTEHEKLGYSLDGEHRRLSYAQIKFLLEQLCSRFGWQPVMEGEHIIGATMDGQSISIEPGGQFELSGAPVDTLHKTCAEVNSHLYQVKTIAQEMGIAFLGLGFDPKWRVEDVPVMPKQRYRIMKEYMPQVGTLGHDMMFRSCTIQVNLDWENEQDMVEKLQIGVALQPVATALFANSPFREGKPTGYLSWRSHVWTDVDNARCGNLPFIWQPGMGFERYVDYALDVPMYFVYREGRYIQATGQSFRDFMRGQLPALPGEYPTMKDWAMHLSTIFPEVRVKNYMEMRGADGGPWKVICALPALWAGLLYDRQSQAEACELIRDWSLEEHDYLRAEVPRTALRTPWRGGSVQGLSQRVLELSRAGLQRRGAGEEDFLAPLEAIAESGVTQADRLLQLYERDWGRDIDRLYVPEFSY